MTTAFLPFVSTATAALGAAAELFQLLADVSLLLLGVRLASAILDTLARIAAALRYAAELTLLLLALVLSIAGDLAPVAGRYLGRYAGSAYRYGRQARALYDAHLHPVASALVRHLDRAGRAFVADQLGTAYPALTAAIASVPSEAPSSPVEPPQSAPAPVSTPATEAPLTRRQLLALAKARKVRGYSRLSTDELRQAIAA